MFTKCFINVYTSMFLKLFKVSDFKVENKFYFNLRTASGRNELFATVG